MSYPSSIENFKRYQAAKQTLYNDHSTYYVPDIYNPTKLKQPPTPVSRAPPTTGATDKAFDVVGGAATAVGAASSVFPLLAPVAAGLGVGYGIYKIGKSISLW